MISTVLNDAKDWMVDNCREQFEQSQPDVNGIYEQIPEGAPIELVSGVTSVLYRIGVDVLSEIRDIREGMFNGELMPKDFVISEFRAYDYTTHENAFTRIHFNKFILDDDEYTRLNEYALNSCIIDELVYEEGSQSIPEIIRSSGNVVKTVYIPSTMKDIDSEALIFLGGGYKVNTNNTQFIVNMTREEFEKVAIDGYMGHDVFIKDFNVKFLK